VLAAAMLDDSFSQANRRELIFHGALEPNIVTIIIIVITVTLAE
jgi:hypothetical protein